MKKYIDSSVKEFDKILSVNEIVDSKRRALNQNNNRVNNLTRRDMDPAFYDMYMKALEQRQLLDDAARKTVNNTLNNQIYATTDVNKNWTFPAQQKDPNGQIINGTFDVKKRGRKYEYSFVDANNNKTSLTKSEFRRAFNESARLDLKQQYGIDDLYTITARDGSQIVFQDERDGTNANKAYNDGLSGINVYYKDPQGTTQQLNCAQANNIVKQNGISQADVEVGFTERIEEAAGEVADMAGEIAESISTVVQQAQQNIGLMTSTRA